jgi:hypothetical protein
MTLRFFFFFSGFSPKNKNGRRREKTETLNYRRSQRERAELSL